MKINKHIEIVRCGISRLSSMGLKSCTMLQELLAQHYERVEVTNVSNKADLLHLINKKPDLVFAGFKSLSGHNDVLDDQPEIWLSETLATHNINFTGSGMKAMELDHNKDAAKQVIYKAGLATAPYFMAQPQQYPNAQMLPLTFPLFIKPPKAGGGKGIDDESIVRDFPAFNRKVKAIASTFGTGSLVEKYLVGREFSVALLETRGGKGMLAMPIELISEPNKYGDRLLSKKVKSDDTEHVIPVLPGKLRQQLITLASSAFKVLGARDYGRIDIRMDENEELYFLEANLIPGIAQHDFTSYFTTACSINAGMDYENMILKIVALGLARSTNTIKNNPQLFRPGLTRTALVAPFAEPDAIIGSGR